MVGLVKGHKVDARLKEHFGDRLIEDLPVGVRQRVEILKALFRKASILILDEPTAVLTPLEVEGLYSTLDGLKAAGKTVGRIGSTATGMAFSFATTYALGQLARRYYAGGRTMNTVMLRDTFQSLLGPAKQMQTQYLPQIQQKAATLDAGQVMAMIRNP